MQKDILILGDYKDDASRIQHKHYADGNGQLFWHLLYEAGVNVRDVAFEYSRSGRVDISAYKIVVPLGQEALSSLSDGSVRKLRGSVLGDGSPWIIPTLHPRTLKHAFEVFREAAVETAQLVLFDLQKVARIYERGFEKPKEDFVVEPSLAELEAFVEESKSYPYLGVDLEGTGLNLDHTDIVTIGFAGSRNRAFVVPLRTTGGEYYWPISQQGRVKKCLDELLLNRKLLFQNGYGYDVPLLRREGWLIPWDNFLADTMLLHHSIDPELPHNIGFISSVWGNQPYWKESFLGRKEHIYQTDQIEMRKYNARDCTALIDIYEAMMIELKDRGLERVFKTEMNLIPPIVTMKAKGIGKDVKKVKAWQEWINGELDVKNDDVRRDFNLPSAFNFNSQDHMNWLLYGSATDGLRKKVEALKEYDKKVESVQYECITCRTKRSFKYESTKYPATVEAKCKKCQQNMPMERTSLPPKEVKAKSRTTAIYKSLDDARSILENDPLTKPKSFRPSRTDSGKYGAGVEDIARYLNAVHVRQGYLDGLKRPTELHEMEAKGLVRSADFLERFGELAKLLKLRASFFDLPTGRDGRIHPSLLIQGTATGRFSCIGPNAQQMPNSKSVAGGKVRDLFRAINDDYVLISADYSNLEVQVGARFMEDKVLLSQLDARLDIHDENTKTFFGVSKDNPRWAKLRAVSKIIQFGRLFYGGSDRGIYSKVRTAVPDLKLEFGVFKEAVRNYFSDHPDFASFVEEVQARAKEDRISSNGYGRVRRLYAGIQSVPRQALNSPIQGSAADFVNDVIIRLWNRGLGNGYESYVALQIHDELLFMVKKSELDTIGPIINEEMLRPQTITTYKGNEVTFSVPVQAEIGTNWGSMDGYNLLTGKITKGTTH